MSIFFWRDLKNNPRFGFLVKFWPRGNFCKNFPASFWPTSRKIFVKILIFCWLKYKLSRKNGLWGAPLAIENSSLIHIDAKFTQEFESEVIFSITISKIGRKSRFTVRHRKVIIKNFYNKLIFLSIFVWRGIKNNPRFGFVVKFWPSGILITYCQNVKSWKWE